jgi:hypothetical protein
VRTVAERGVQLLRRRPEVAAVEVEVADEDGDVESVLRTAQRDGMLDALLLGDGQAGT